MPDHICGCGKRASENDARALSGWQIVTFDVCPVCIARDLAAGKLAKQHGNVVVVEKSSFMGKVIHTLNMGNVTK